MNRIKSIDVIYQEGQFLNPFTFEPIILKENAEVKIIVLAEDILDSEFHPKDSNEKREELESMIRKGRITSYKKIMHRNDMLSFTIHKSHLSFQKTFEVQLLEDLFLIQKGNDLNNPRAISLHDCLCKLIGSNDSVYGYSLSDLYKNVYISQLGKNGSPSANAFETFYVHNTQQKLAFLRDEWKNEIERRQREI